jgi:hypothetical protein
MADLPKFEPYLQRSLGSLPSGRTRNRLVDTQRPTGTLAFRLTASQSHGAPSITSFFTRSWRSPDTCVPSVSTSAMGFFRSSSIVLSTSMSATASNMRSVIVPTPW